MRRQSGDALLGATTETAIKIIPPAEIVISPADFSALAEKADIIMPIGRQVLAVVADLIIGG